MTSQNHKTFVYVGIGGEHPLAAAAEPNSLGEGGLFRRGDDEEAWQPLTDGLPADPQVRAMAIHPENPQVLFAGTQDGVYRTSDRGEHWEATDSPKAEVWSIVFHPTKPDIMLAGFDKGMICKSEDSGLTWKKTDTGKVVFPHITMEPTEIVKRIIGLSFDAASPLDVYGAVEVGGLLASRNGGETWESITDGHYTRMGPVDLHGVQVNSSAAGLVYIITQLAMFRSRDRGQRWEFVPIDEMFPGGSYCRGLIVAPNDPNIMYLAAGAGGGSAPQGTVEEGALMRSKDAGETWDRLDLGDVPSTRMFQIAIDAAAPSHVYCTDYSGDVYSSYDSGETWSKSQVPLETSRARHVYPMVCG